MVYKTQRQLEKLPSLHVPQRPFNRPANPEIGQLMKESNDLLNVRVFCVFTSHYEHAQRPLSPVLADFISTPTIPQNSRSIPTFPCKNRAMHGPRAPPFFFSPPCQSLPNLCFFTLPFFLFSFTLPYLWLPYGIGQAIIFLRDGFFLFFLA